MSMRDFWDAYKVGYSTTNDAFDRRREQERYEQQQLAAQRQAELDRILQQQQFQREMQQMKDKAAMDRAVLSSPRGGGAGSANRAPAQPWNWDSPPPSNAAPEQVKQAADNFAARNKYMEQRDLYDKTVDPIRDQFATGLSEYNAIQDEMRRNQEEMAAGDRKEGGILWGAIGGKRRDELLKEQKQAAIAKLQDLEKVDMTILPPRMRQDYADALIALGPDLPEYLQRIGRTPDTWPQMLLEGVQSGAVRPEQASRMKDILRAAGY